MRRLQIFSLNLRNFSAQRPNKSKKNLDFLTKKLPPLFSSGYVDCNFEKTDSQFHPKCEIFPLKKRKKILNFSFSNGFRLQHFALEQKREFCEVHVETKMLKGWNHSAENQRKNSRKFFSWTISIQKFLLDTYNATSRKLPRCSRPMCIKLLTKMHKKGQIQGFSKKKFLCSNKIPDW